MGATTAEVARTMASGRLLGVVHLRGHPDRLRVRHATGADGNPLLLTRRTGALAAALRPRPGETGTAAVLSVDDAPPAPGAPCHGRLWLSGWASLLAGPPARAAALAYAELNPCSDLLDLGEGHVLYRLEVAEVRLASGQRLTEIDPDDYRAAAPDPLHREEPELLAEFASNDARRLRELYVALAGHRLPAGARAVRVDRFGVVLVVPDARSPRRMRLEFPIPLTDRAQLAQLAGRRSPGEGRRG
jgi:hypothetical protein